ncbi:hypothetical protein D3C80_2225170 [compost metagenome]
MDFVLLGFAQHFRCILLRKSNKAVFVANNNIAGVYDHAADRNWYVNFPWPAFIGAAMYDASSV